MFKSVDRIYWEIQLRKVQFAGTLQFGSPCRPYEKPQRKRKGSTKTLDTVCETKIGFPGLRRGGGKRSPLAIADTDRHRAVTQHPHFGTGRPRRSARMIAAPLRYPLQECGEPLKGDKQQPTKGTGRVGGEAGGRWKAERAPAPYPARGRCEREAAQSCGLQMSAKTSGSDCPAARPRFA